MRGVTVPPPLAGGGKGEGATHPEEEKPSGLLTRARIMRREPTRSERLLWKTLRTKQLDGWKFRRQVPLGPYIVDFYCAAACLVIELDGEPHVGSVTDPVRDEWLRGQGLHVLRFWNNEVLGNFDGVLRLIIESLHRPLPPAPSRKGRGSRSSL